MTQHAVPSTDDQREDASRQRRYGTNRSECPGREQQQRCRSSCGEGIDEEARDHGHGSDQRNAS